VNSAYWWVIFYNLQTRIDFYCFGRTVSVFARRDKQAGVTPFQWIVFRFHFKRLVGAVFQT